MQLGWRGYEAKQKKIRGAPKIAQSDAKTETGKARSRDARRASLHRLPPKILTFGFQLLLECDRVDSVQLALNSVWESPARHPNYLRQFAFRSEGLFDSHAIARAVKV